MSQKVETIKDYEEKTSAREKLKSEEVENCYQDQSDKITNRSISFPKQSYTTMDVFNPILKLSLANCKSRPKTNLERYKDEQTKYDQPIR